MAGNRNRLKFKLPFGEGEAEGLFGIIALVFIVVFVIAITGAISIPIKELLPWKITKVTPVTVTLHND